MRWSRRLSRCPWSPLACLPKSRGDFLKERVKLAVGDLKLGQPGLYGRAREPLIRLGQQSAAFFTQFVYLGIDLGN
jgi:hypothetical protein